MNCECHIIQLYCTERLPCNTLAGLMAMYSNEDIKRAIDYLQIQLDIASHSAIPFLVH